MASAERVYYRDVRTGDRGYMIEEDGKKCIKLDRPMHSVVRVYREQDWAADRETRPLTEAQCAQVAFAADVLLCKFLGYQALAKREWLLLKDTERIQWVQEGPPVGIRQTLWRETMNLLAKLR